MTPDGVVAEHATSVRSRTGTGGQTGDGGGAVGAEEVAEGADVVRAELDGAFTVAAGAGVGEGG